MRFAAYAVPSGKQVQDATRRPLWKLEEKRAGTPFENPALALPKRNLFI